MALGPHLPARDRGGRRPAAGDPAAATDEAIEPLLDRLDGLCLSGGPDLDPGTYGAEPHDELGPTEPDLDRFELAIARRADAREMPILAICRGTQALNVVRGGTLHQHLPELSERDPAPAEGARRPRPTHPVEIEPGSRLARRSATTSCGSPTSSTSTPSTTRRSTGSATGLEVTARAPDGTIEAIEDPSRDRS